MPFKDPIKRREYHRKYDKDWCKKHKEHRNKTNLKRKRKIMEFIYRYKLSAGCFDCGYNAHSEALQFDHVIGTKIKTISEARGFAHKLLMAEVNKCVVRCANCHAVKTMAERYS